MTQLPLLIFLIVILYSFFEVDRDNLIIFHFVFLLICGDLYVIRNYNYIIALLIILIRNTIF